VLLIKTVISWLLVLPCFAAAPSSGELDDLFAFRGIVLQQDDNNGGNPYVSEDASIYEGLFLYRSSLGAEDALQGKFTGDVVSAASYDDAREKAETVSGATGYNPGRFNIDIAWLHQSLDWGFSIGTSYGQEYAYRSQGYNLSGNLDLAEGATQLSASLQVFNDQVRVIRFDGSKEHDQVRNTDTLNLGWTQSLTPTRVLNLGWSNSQQRGMLATSFNAVKVDDHFEFEQLPEHRIRNAGSIRYKQANGEDSWQLGFSRYQDSWDVKGNTLELRYYAHFNRGQLVLEPVYRYYQQQQSRYFAWQFDGLPPFRSSDSDLGDFDGHTLGLNVSWLGSAPWLQRQAWYDMGFQVYDRSDNIRFYWLTVGWRYPQ
jgi:hypothetical protein|tara:strand:- start:3425 stop:4537 length:1113 start_codon:yes stop_codon:yes gene_type:complete